MVTSETDLDPHGDAIPLGEVVLPHLSPLALLPEALYVV